MTKKIFGKVQAALLLDAVLKVAIPETVRINLANIMSEMERRQIVVWRYGRKAIFAVDLVVENVVLMSCTVIVAKGNQGTNLKLDTLKSLIGCSLQLVMHDDSVLSLHHENRLLQSQSLDFVGKHRKGIEPKAGLILKALRMDRAWILIGGKFVALTINDQCLLKL